MHWRWASVEPSSRDLQVSAGPEHTIQSKATPLQDLIKLFPNVQTLHLPWNLKLAGTPRRLLPQVKSAPPLVTPTTLFPTLTELVLNFSEQKDGKGFGGAEMLMLFEHLCLFNLQTLRLVFQPSDVDGIGGVDEWLRLEKALKKMQFPRLKTLVIIIFIPAYDWPQYDVGVSAVGVDADIMHSPAVLLFQSGSFASSLKQSPKRALSRKYN